MALKFSFDLNGTVCELNYSFCIDKTTLTSVEESCRYYRRTRNKEIVCLCTSTLDKDYDFVSVVVGHSSHPLTYRSMFTGTNIVEKAQRQPPRLESLRRSRFTKILDWNPKNGDFSLLDSLGA